jgi:hypothetical protein
VDLDFGEDEVCEEIEDGKHEADEGSEEGKPLIVR